MKTIIALLICFLIRGIFTSCDKEENGNTEYQVLKPENTVARGERLFGINISESQAGFISSFEKATEAGTQLVEINMPWSEIEVSEGVYVDPNGIFSSTTFYGSNSIKVGLSLAVINTVQWEVPDYLKDEPVNSQKFIDAFNNLVDWVLDTFPENVEIPFLSVGNEVDLVLETNDEWTSYTEFFEEAASHIKTNYPQTNVGVKTTVMGGLYGTEKSEIQLINQFSDVVMLNYYPQDFQFKVLEPEIVHSHFGDIVTWFPGKEIWMTEVGYQSGSNLCESSEEKQGHFYHNMFEAWDSYNEQIKVVIIDWLYDQSPKLIEEWKHYYGNDPALVEYLSTLGLLNYDGTEKAAWKQVMAETGARGWN